MTRSSSGAPAAAPVLYFTPAGVGGGKYNTQARGGIQEMANTQKPVATDSDELARLLGQLCQVGQQPDRALLDRVKAYGQAAVRPLIQMAVDEKLHHADSTSPEV